MFTPEDSNLIRLSRAEEQRLRKKPLPVKTVAGPSYIAAWYSQERWMPGYALRTA